MTTQEVTQKIRDKFDNGFISETEAINMTIDGVTDTYKGITCPIEVIREALVSYDQEKVHRILDTPNS